MSTITLDGNVKVSWLAGLGSIVDITAPTVAELSAELVLESTITPDGLSITPTTGKIDNSNLGSTFTTSTNGRRAFAITVKFHRKSVTADAVATAMVYGQEGYLVVRRGLPKATGWVAAQAPEVYPSQVSEPAVPASAAEQNWDYMVDMAVIDDPCTVATVAA